MIRECEKRPKRVFINPIYKDKVTTHQGIDENGKSFQYGELEVWPGGGNSYHVHTDFEEKFTAIEGKLGVALKGKKIYLEPGQSYIIPRNTPHHFFNDGKEPITCHVQFFPEQADFVKGIAIAYGLASDGLSTPIGLPKNPVHLAIVMKLTGTVPAGIAGLLKPIIFWLAKRGRKNGTESALLNRYYYE